MTLEIGVFSMAYNSRTGEVEVLSGTDGCTNRTIDDRNRGPMPGCNGTTSARNWACRGYGAAACALGPCLKTYTATVNNGVVNELLLRETAAGEFFNDAHPYVGAAADTSCITTDDRTHLIREVYVLTLQRWIAYNFSSDPAFTFRNASGTLPNTSYFFSMISRNCVYFRDRTVEEGYKDFFLYFLLVGTVYGLRGFMGTLYRYNGSRVLQHFYNFGYNDFDWVTGIIRNASTALTYHIRINGMGGMSTSAEDVMHHFATCVGIEWGWIALPASLVALMIFLLFISIWTSQAKKLPVWMSSPLAYLLHEHVHGTIMNPTASGAGQLARECHTYSMSSLEDASQRLLVRLEDVDDDIILNRTGKEFMPAAGLLKRLGARREHRSGRIEQLQYPERESYKLVRSVLAVLKMYLLFVSTEFCL